MQEKLINLANKVNKCPFSVVISIKDSHCVGGEGPHSNRLIHEYSAPQNYRVRVIHLQKPIYNSIWTLGQARP